MSDLIIQFCSMVKHRSEENQRAMQLIATHCLPPVSPAFSLLRQELDSMVKVIFLLSIDPSERERYINALLSGQKWKIQTSSGKERQVLDKDMVELA